VPDRVDADVDRVQPPGAKPVLNRVPCHPHHDQLTMRHDAVLPRRQSSNPTLTWFISTATIAHEMNHVGHVAERGTWSVTAGLQALQLCARGVTK
jgi:hypothetical protein